MRSFVVVGDDTQFQSYVRDFITLHNIPSSYVYQYSDVFKIVDARGVRKVLASRTEEGLNRLFVLPSNITIEAQNALLKSIEELPSDTYILIHSQTGQEFLPTIFSRCSVIHFKRETASEVRGDVAQCYKQYVASDTVDSSFLLAEKISTLEETEFYSFLAFLSTLMKKDLLDGRGEQAVKTYRFLQQLFFYRPYLKKNNLNKRLTFETIAISLLSH